jgi:hypothetical protein
MKNIPSFRPRSHTVLTALVVGLSSLLMASVCPNPYGVNSSTSFYGNGTCIPAAAYDRESSLGVSYHRTTFLWDVIETAPSACINGDAAHCHWEIVQPDIDAAKAKGLFVLVDIIHTPCWDAAPPDTGRCPSHPNCQNVNQGCSSGHTFSCPPAHWQSIQTFVIAAAQHFGTEIDAWEIGGEPDTCNVFTGSHAEFRLNLEAAFDGIRSVNPNAVILAPGLFNQTGFDPWLTENGSLVRPINYYSLHTYESVAAAKADLDAADKYVACMNTPSGVYCVDHYWLTEFGYADGGSCQVCSWGTPCSPSVATTEVIDYCLNSELYCDKVFYWDMIFNKEQNCASTCPDASCTSCCRVSLLGDSATPRPMYCAYKNYIASNTVLSCPYNDPPCNP